jgi:deferrochelatase/peroxidase EfeB
MSAAQSERLGQGEFDDVQGLVRFAFKNHTEAAFLLLRIRDPATARAWLAQAALTNAVARDPPPKTVVQVAFTYDGLRALGVAADILAEFSAEFIEGMSDNADRARLIGDVGRNDSKYWDWGAGERKPHAALLLYALPGSLAAWEKTVRGELAGAFEEVARLSTSNMGGVEPFGFVDGISQPELDWKRRRPAVDQDDLEYLNLSCVGEFLLGYPNEYGLYTPRPLVRPDRDRHEVLPRAEDATGLKDLGRNGTYLVIRQLRQDVCGFWRALDRYASGQADLRVRMAEALVGRTMQGESLVGLLHEDIAGNAPGAGGELNAFTYRSDSQGVRCPLGAHIRRTNPRSGDLPPGASGPLSRLVRTFGVSGEARRQDLVAAARFHRLLRRGREYGTLLTPEQALANPVPAPDSGLQFVCINANIERQFEFVQSAWVMSAKFNGLSDQADPLLGNRVPGPGESPTDWYRLPQSDGPDRRLTELPQFITVIGGAYFFLPGIRALRFLSTTG